MRLPLEFFFFLCSEYDKSQEKLNVTIFSPVPTNQELIIHLVTSKNIKNYLGKERKKRIYLSHFV